MSATAIDSMIFRDMFATEAMRRVFSDENRVQKYLDVEAALARAQARLGIIPQDAADEIVRHCAVDELDMGRLKRDTEKVGYPVMPVVQQLTKLCRDGLGEWSHWGATTQDITDTAMVLQMREALALVEDDIDAIVESLAELARKHRDTVMAARTAMQQAIPTTFGHTMAVLLAAFVRHKQRLAELRPRVLVGQLGGAVGTLASLGDRGLAVQDALMDELGLGRPEIAWHTMRDRIAEAGCFLGLLAGTCGKLALDVKLLMQTEVQEVYEPFHEGRGSSSTMPQKRNPVSSTFISATSTAVRRQVGALLDAMVQDHERATGEMQLEWIVLPETFSLSAAMLAHTRFVVSDLQVDAARMRKNLDITKGLVMSEAVMMGVAPHLGRQRAHHHIQDIVRRVVATGRPLCDLLLEDEEISRHLDRDAIERLCDPANYVGEAGAMIDRVLALAEKRK